MIGNAPRRGRVRYGTAIGTVLFFSVSVLAVAFFRGAFVNIILFFALFILLMYGAQSASWYVIVGAFVLDVVTPFAPYTVLGALITAVFGANVILTRYITHRALLGAVVCGVVGALLFELAILFFASLGAFFSQGFMPALNRAYGIFFLQRIAIMPLLLAFVFWTMRKISPNVRGVLLE